MIRILIRPEDPGHIELLSAWLSGLFNEGLEIGEDGIIAYASEDELNSREVVAVLKSLRGRFPFERHDEPVPAINWNRQWESGFDPVVIDDVLTIKADFHDIQTVTEYAINIQPKMSFGTGHHATTWMMVRVMSMLRMENRKVLDAGTGTGILAILSAMWKASRVTAFDNDEWSYENARENLAKNLPPDSFPHINFMIGSLSDIGENDFDIILANIDRNFLLEESEALASKLSKHGLIVISGFYDVDSKLLLDRFHALNLVAHYLLTRDGWACIVLINNAN